MTAEHEEAVPKHIQEMLSSAAHQTLRALVESNPDEEDVVSVFRHDASVGAIMCYSVIVPKSRMKEWGL